MNRNKAEKKGWSVVCNKEELKKWIDIDRLEKDKIEQWHEIVKYRRENIVLHEVGYEKDGNAEISWIYMYTLVNKTMDDILLQIFANHVRREIVIRHVKRENVDDVRSMIPGKVCYEMQKRGW